MLNRFIKKATDAIKEIDFEELTADAKAKATELKDSAKTKYDEFDVDEMSDDIKKTATKVTKSKV